MTLDFNGQKFTGDEFSIKNQVLYVDGHAVADLKPHTEELSISGAGNLTTDNPVVIYGTFTGNIKAEKVIVNGEVIGNIKAQQAIINEKITGNVIATNITDNS